MLEEWLSQPQVLDTIWPTLCFAVGGLLFSLGELLWPVRSVQRRPGFVIDTLGLVLAWSVSGIVIGAVAALLSRWAPPPSALAALPAALRGVVFIALSDLARFSVHWAMHRDSLWRMHAFHHSVEQLHWYSGNRASALHVILFMAPMAGLAWLFSVTPLWIALNVALMTLWNHLMHTNLRLPAGVSRTLEYLVTTPRLHHIHHSNDARHYGANYASILTIWDRMLGSYVDPDGVDASRLRFGAPTVSDKLWRKLLGW